MLPEVILYKFLSPASLLKKNTSRKETHEKCSLSCCDTIFADSNPICETRACIFTKMIKLHTGSKSDSYSIVSHIQFSIRSKKKQEIIATNIIIMITLFIIKKTTIIAGKAPGRTGLT